MINKKILNIINEIINERFKNYSSLKREIKVYNNERINFSCPYCLDSYKLDKKKRGNIYLSSYTYHCFNCGIHKDLISFLKDFNKINNFSFEEIDKIKDIIKNNSDKDNYFLNYNNLNFNYNFDNYAISLNKIINKFNIIPIKYSDNNFIKNYLLKERCINYEEYDNFFVNKNNELFILNLTKNNNVLGIQIRLFNNLDKKYLSLNLKKLYSLFNFKFDDEKIEYINNFSLLFNFDKVDKNKEIIVTEGAIDSFLLPNSISMSGITKNIDFLNNLRLFFLFDRDKIGKKYSLKYIKEGKYVFLWDKFLKENKFFDLLNKEKLDWNDVHIYLIKNNINFYKYNIINYFSNNLIDIYWI